MNRLRFALIAALAIATGACAQGTQSASSRTSGVDERNVRFSTKDNVRLAGRLFGRGRVGVTLGHMYTSDARSWYPTARQLAKAGYMALAFNFRGYDGSQGPKQVDKAPVDLEAARDFLLKSGAGDIAFVGASMGGTASMMAANALDPLAVVSVSAPLRFMGLDAIQSAGRIQRPVLLLTAKGDAPAFESLQELARALPNPDTRIFDGSAHGTSLLLSRPEAVQRIIRFLQRYAPVEQARASSSP